MVTKKEQYIEVLKRFDNPVTILEWAKEIIRVYPVTLEQINSKTNELMTLKDLVSRLSLNVSEGDFSNILVDNTQPYQKVQYFSENDKRNLIEERHQKDMEYVLVESKKEEDIQKSTEFDRYRLEEFSQIVTQLNGYFKLNFKLHHTYSLLSETQSSKHHVGNLEILRENDSELKSDGDQRFTIEEQKAYIKRVISIHLMIVKDIDITLTDEVLDMLLDRLEKVY